MQDFVVIATLAFFYFVTLVLGFRCLKLRRQRDVFHRAFDKYHLYTPIPDGEELFAVMDQIEGVKKKKKERE